MTDDPVSVATPTSHSRPELLRLLQDDPRAVSRAEIKAAFADGRLGDQDLDIPVLAGMRRITELLADLGPGSGVAGAIAATDLADTPAHGTPSGGRATATSVRVSELEGHLGALTERVVTLETSLAAERAALADQEALVAAHARTLRIMGIVLAVLVAVLAITLVVSFSGR